MLTNAPDESALPPDVAHILQGLKAVGIPVLCVPLDTFSATSRLNGIHGLPPGGMLTPSSTVKLQVISDLYSQSSCSAFIRAIRTGRTGPVEMTSHIFLVTPVVPSAPSRESNVAAPTRAAGDTVGRSETAQQVRRPLADGGTAAALV